MPKILGPLRFEAQIREHFEQEVFGPPGRGDDPVGHGLLEFGFGGPGVLRDREVLGESVGAADGHGAGDPDQFPGPDVKDLFVLVVENLFADFHGGLLPPLAQTIPLKDTICRTRGDATPITA